MNENEKAPETGVITYEWTPTPEGGAALVEHVPDRVSRPPLPKACIEEAARHNQDAVWWHENVWAKLRGTTDVPAFDVPRIPRDVPPERRTDVTRDLHGWTVERDEAAKQAGIPEGVRSKARVAGLDPRVYFEQEIRPGLTDATTDYQRPAPKVDPGARSAAENEWNDHLGRVAYETGLDEAAIRFGQAHNMNPFRVHDQGLHLPREQRGGWRPTAAMIAKRNGTEHLLNFTSDVETDALRAELAYATTQAALWRTKDAPSLVKTYEEKARDAHAKLTAKAKSKA